MALDVKTLCETRALWGCVRQFLSNYFTTRKMRYTDHVLQTAGYSILLGPFRKICGNSKAQSRIEIVTERKLIVQNNKKIDASDLQGWWTCLDITLILVEFKD